MNINVFDENSQLKELVVGNSFNFKSNINLEIYMIQFRFIII